jgi:hypothetical protein
MTEEKVETTAKVEIEKARRAIAIKINKKLESGVKLEDLIILATALEHISVWE